MKSKALFWLLGSRKAYEKKGLEEIQRKARNRQGRKGERDREIEREKQTGVKRV